MNKLIEIHEFAMEQMEKWGLIEEGWSFVWDNRAVRRYGQCRYRQREIGVTKKLALINTIEESKDVALHEIAHALTGRGMVMTTYGNVCVGRSGPNQRDVINLKIEEDRLIQ